MAGNGRSRRFGLGLGVESLEGRMVPSTGLGSPLFRRAAEMASMNHSGTSSPTAARWAWMVNTYWYVPKPNLPATIFSPSSGAIVPVLDQTVYHISGYRNGYFWGETVTQLGQGAPTSSALVGSVTPQGRVLLTFTSSSNTIEGYGTMVRKKGQWTMENQMFTLTSSGQVGHWAYMVQTRPGMASWNSLPLVGVSVPTFLSNYSAPTPTPVVAS